MRADACARAGVGGAQDQVTGVRREASVPPRAVPAPQLPPRSGPKGHSPQPHLSKGVS